VRPVVGAGSAGGGVEVGARSDAAPVRLFMAMTRRRSAASTSPLISALVDSFNRARASSISSRRSFFALAAARLCAFLDCTTWNCAGSCAWCMYTLAPTSKNTVGGRVPKWIVIGSVYLYSPPA
jgi:hypothetical protein